MGPCLFVPVDDPTCNFLGIRGILFIWTETQGDAAELKVEGGVHSKQLHTIPAENFQLSRVLQKPTLSAKESENTLPVQQQIKNGGTDILFLKPINCRNSSMGSWVCREGVIFEMHLQRTTIYMLVISPSVKGTHFRLLEARPSPRSTFVHTKMKRRKMQ